MQHDIILAARKTGANSKSVRMLQRKLIKSIEGRMMAFKMVINNQGSRTPGVDGITYTKEDFGSVVQQLGSVTNY